MLNPDELRDHGNGGRTGMGFPPKMCQGSDGFQTIYVTNAIFLLFFDVFFGVKINLS